MNGKVRVFDVDVSVVDYRQAVAALLEAAVARRSYAATALATHGLMEAARDPELAAALNRFDLVTPDGQPVRWAMNLLHGVGLRDRVYGPDLMLALCEAAAQADVGVYLFGSTPDTCRRLAGNLQARWPALRLIGVQPDRFREATPDENAADVQRIEDSGAGIVFVGRGCPRQERWVAAHRGRVHAAMVAVGAAFDYHAGRVPHPPSWMQRAGLEWLYRLSKDPRRLARRYLVHNTRFLLRLGRELWRKGAG